MVFKNLKDADQNDDTIRSCLMLIFCGLDPDIPLRMNKPQPLEKTKNKSSFDYFKNSGNIVKKLRMVKSLLLDS